MTKKHFEAIAKAIRDAKLSTLDGAPFSPATTRLLVAGEIAGELATLCPNFEAGRFIRAATGTDAR